MSEACKGNDGEKRKAKLADASGCNSVTHPTWYAQFARDVANRKICPIELGPSLKKDKTDVFRMWLEEGSLMRVLLRVKRKATKSSEGSDKYIWTKERDLKYAPEKKAKLIQKKKKDGLWCYDPEFPNDESEIMILVLDKSSYVVSDKIEESVSAEGKQNLDQEAAKSLLGEGGMLAAGRVAAVPHMSDAGQSNFLAGFGGTKQHKGPPPAGNKIQEAKQVLPETTLDLINTMLPDILKESGEAGKYAVALEPFPVAKPTVDGMKQHAKLMKGLYKRMQKLVIKKEDPSESNGRQPL